ncbi:MAG: histidine kinase [Ignavibacteriaceae bacterium]|jgi:sensor histidine kinase YesM
MKKIVIAVSATLVLSIIFSVLFKWFQSDSPLGPSTVLYGVLVFLNIWILGFTGFKILKRFSSNQIGKHKLQVIPAFIIFAVVALLESLVLIYIGIYIYYQLNGFDTSNFLKQFIDIELPSILKQYSVWILISSAFFFYMIYKSALDRESHLREDNLKYKYNNLKAHINPHFLFNSLNTISELVYVDADRTDNYIQKLSGIYRYILENEENDLVPLNNELEFVKQYFDLQKVRDEGKILLEIKIDNPERFKVIPVSLQTLVENALKHNIASKGKPLNIIISNSDSYLVVSNNLQKKNTLGNSTKTGLNNLMERVKLITKNNLVVNEDPDEFIVKLPIIKA